MNVLNFCYFGGRNIPKTVIFRTHSGWESGPDSIRLGTGALQGFSEPHAIGVGSLVFRELQ
jgi:hypothetical protein